MYFVCENLFVPAWVQRKPTDPPLRLWTTGHVYSSMNRIHILFLIENEQTSRDATQTTGKYV